MTQRTTPLICIAATFLAICTEARSGTVTLYDNLKATSDGQDLVPPPSDQLLADSFSTGDDPLVLISVKVKLVLVGQPDFSKIRPVAIELYKDNGKPGPGDLVAEIGRVTEETVKDDGPVIAADKIAFNQPLAANSRYWIVLTDVAGGTNGKQTISWYWSSDISGTGVANESYIDTTGQFANNDTLFGPFQMQVIAQSAPEPSSLALFAIGILAIGIVCVRTRIRMHRLAAPRCEMAIQFPHR